jgi:hypothetical protein
VCHYKFAAPSVISTAAVLRDIAPLGVVHDITRYDDKSDAILRPGVMVSSTISTLPNQAEETMTSHNSATPGIFNF